jgi:hypothetical protein
MRRLALALLAGIPFLACADADPVAVDGLDAPSSVAEAGAFVVNRGNGQPSVTAPCNFGPYLTMDVTNIRAPGGSQMLFCKFKGLPPVERAVHVKGYRCFLPGGAITFDSHFRRTPSGTASLTCTYKPR